MRFYPIAGAHIERPDGDSHLNTEPKAEASRRGWLALLRSWQLRQAELAATKRRAA